VDIGEVQMINFTKSPPLKVAELYKRLKDAMETLGLSEDDAAKLIGVPISEINYMKQVAENVMVLEDGSND
jgi:hypothetical protein